MQVVTWNVNSVKSRLIHLCDWLRAEKPEIVLLQETKTVDDAFPRMEIEELGYNLALHGEKSYNGVAILSKFPLNDVQRGLTGNEDDERARYIEAVASLPNNKAMRVASVYVPNGQTPDSEKFPYKLRFLDRFREHVKQLLTYEEMLVIGGDYNIAPADIDVHNPRQWANTVLCHSEVRKRLNSVFHLGMYDAHRIRNPQDPGYSWWDYRAGALERDDGLRIDHLLLSPQAADILENCTVNKNIRALEKASDHAPVIGTFKLAA